MPSQSFLAHPDISRAYMIASRLAPIAMTGGCRACRRLEGRHILRHVVIRCALIAIMLGGNQAWQPCAAGNPVVRLVADAKVSVALQLAAAAAFGFRWLHKRRLPSSQEATRRLLVVAPPAKKFTHCLRTGVVLYQMCHRSGKTLWHADGRDNIDKASLKDLAE